MMRIPMSPAAAGLLRALVARAGVNRDRILLTEFRSVDWQSLTFIGERHEFQLKVQGAGASEILNRVLADLDGAELEIPGHLVADVVTIGEPATSADGSMAVSLEALTVERD